MLIKILILFMCIIVVSVYICAYEPGAPLIIRSAAMAVLLICYFIGSIWLTLPVFSNRVVFLVKVVSVIMPLRVFIWIKKKFLKCEKELLSRFGYKLPREDFFFFFCYFPCLIIMFGPLLTAMGLLWTCVGIMLGLFYVTKKYNRQVCLYYCIFLVVGYFYMFYTVLVIVLFIVNLCEK